MILSDELGGIGIVENHLLVLKIRIEKSASRQIVVCHDVVEVEHSKTVATLLQERNDHIKEVRTYNIVVAQEKDELGVGVLYAKEEIVHPTDVLLLLVELEHAGVLLGYFGKLLESAVLRVVVGNNQAYLILMSQYLRKQVFHILHRIFAALVCGYSYRQ